MNGKNLAEFRVAGKAHIELHSKEMSQEDILERRSYIRKALRNCKSTDVSNDVLDAVRLMSEGTGYVLDDENGFEYYIQGMDVSEEETEFRKVRAMIPFEFINLTGKDFDWDIYKKDITREKDYVNNFILKFEKFRENGMGLYIHSATKGSGKTMLSCCILNEIVKRHAVPVKFINALDLLELTKKSYKGVEVEELQSLYDATVLVIDDIGVQMGKEWIDTVFYRLINYRYSNKKVTLYTSNISAKNLKMDERIIERIEGRTFLVALPEVSVRGIMLNKEKEKIMEDIRNSTL